MRACAANLNAEVFYTLREAQIIIENRRHHCNTIRCIARIQTTSSGGFVPAFAAWPARRPPTHTSCMGESSSIFCRYRLAAACAESPPRSANGLRLMNSEARLPRRSCRARIRHWRWQDRRASVLPRCVAARPWPGTTSRSKWKGGADRQPSATGCRVKSAKRHDPASADATPAMMVA
jgi:hypothetical protein